MATTVARELLEDFSDGVWLIELAPLRDHELIASEIAGAVGVRPGGGDALQGLAEALVGERSLIVLDNCEHLLDAAADVAKRLLERCEEVSILATSRSLLRVPGEVAFPVAGLSVPEGASFVASVVDQDAIRLFADRAERVERSFALNSENVVHVAEICRKLDGLPLAIELAAARTNVYALGALAERIGDHLGVLGRGGSTAAPRHRTLDAAIGWSYDLLTEDEQTALDRLSVFRGGFDLDMAEQVVAGAGIDRQDVDAILVALVDKSLVAPYDWAGGRRYRLLETVRSFARDRLEQRGELAVAGHALIQWGLTHAEGFWPGVYSGHDDRDLARLHEDFENLSAAARWVEEFGEETRRRPPVRHPRTTLAGARVPLVVGGGAGAGDRSESRSRASSRARGAPQFGPVGDQSVRRGMGRGRAGL